MRRSLVAATVMVLLWTVVLGLAYPLVTTGVAQVLFPHEADGSLVEVDGRVVGSELIAQPFDGDEWFHPRPSAVDHDPTASGASNLGPTSPELAAAVARRVESYREANGLGAAVPVPVDAVTASGSGLDPHISVANARLQAPRVAAARGLDTSTVLGLVDDHTTRRVLGILGEEGVNVLALNLALVELGGP